MSWNAPNDIAERYYAFVKQCLTEEAVFNNFRSNEDYISIVGTALFPQYLYFMARISQYPDVIAKQDEFRRNDVFGNAPYIVPEVNLSMGTVRYVFTLCDLIKHFGDLNGKVISELGVGYGGMAYIFSCYFKPQAYHLLDLEDVKLLATKYLNRLNVPCSGQEPPESVDLFISEFCLSEFDDADIDKFYEKYIKKAKNVYLTMNMIEPDRKQKFIDKIGQDFKLEVYPETHGTNFPSYVIIGKK